MNREKSGNREGGRSTMREEKKNNNTEMLKNKLNDGMH